MQEEDAEEVLVEKAVEPTAEDLDKMTKKASESVMKETPKICSSDSGQHIGVELCLGENCQ